MQKTSRIFVAGHRGLVGSALVRHLARKGYERVAVQSRQELDASDPKGVREYFETAPPEYVFLAAACVGGIKARDRKSVV